MSNSGGSDPFGFGKFIPGFEFLQSLSQAAGGAGTAGAQAPLAGMAQWVAPTLNVEEIDKRIQELRAVQFWLEQNGRALTATIQALEVQKMTLATLQSMQGGINDWAKASPFKMPEAAAHAPAPSPATPPPAPAPATAPTPPPPPAAAPAAAADAGSDASAAAPTVDPLQWWGALTQQFQQIATQALQEPAGQKAMEAGTQMASEFARNAMQSAADLAKAVPAAPAAKPAAAAPAAAAPAAKKAAPRKPAAAPAAAPKAAARKPAATKTTPARKTPRRAP